MAYQTGQFTNPVDLLQKLIAFLQTNGWTINMSQALGAHWRAHIQKNSAFINLFAAGGNSSNHWPWSFSQYISASADTGALFVNASDGYDGGAAWNNQPGKMPGYNTANTLGAGMKLVAAGSNSYHFFSNGDGVTVVAERVAGEWHHIGWGMLQKAGNYTGGRFFFGDCNAYRVYDGNYNAIAWAPMGDGTRGGYDYLASGFVRADVDSYVGRWLNISTTGTMDYTYGHTGRFARSSAYAGNVPSSLIPGNNGMAERAVSSVTGQITLGPIRIFASRDASPGGYSLLGTVPDIFDIRNSYTGGSVISLGSDDYVIFPNFAVRKVA